MDVTIHSRLSILAATCGFMFCTAAANAQWLEFTGAEVRGRIDQSTPDNYWTVGDDNGNGSLDEGETFATRVKIDDVFLTGPGYVYTGPDRVELRLGNDRVTSPSTQLIGFSNYGGVFVEAGNVPQRGGAANGVVDDLNGNLAEGPVGIFGDPDSDGDLDLLGIQVDYSDFYYFSVGPTLSVYRPYVRYGGVQLMHVLGFDVNPEYSISTTQESLEVGYGARFRGDSQDDQNDAVIPLLSPGIQLHTTLDNRALGPQASIRWTLRRGRWQARAEAAAAVMYMDIDGDSSIRLGEQVVPGGLNQPANVQPVARDHHLDEWDLAPAVEAGLMGSYDLTPSSRVFIRCDAIQFHNIRDVQQSLVYRLPEMGLRDPGGRDVTITSASLGLELRR